MSLLQTVCAIVLLIASALVGGIFFAFSNFIMKALARLPSAEGIRAMQSINVVVLNPGFLGLFAGTAVVASLQAALALWHGQAPASPWLLSGALAYVLGTFLVTGLGNVPLNERLAAADAAGAGSVPGWDDYQVRWTRLNTIRTVAAIMASGASLIGLTVGMAGG